MAKWLLCNKVYLPDGTICRPGREFDDAVTPLQPFEDVGAIFLALPNVLAEKIALLMRNQQSHGWTDEEAQAFLLSYAKPPDENANAAFLQDFPIEDAMPTQDLQVLMALGGQAVWSRISQDMIVPGFDVTMASGIGTTHRIGTSIVQPNFTTVVTNGPLTSAILTDNAGSLPKNVLSTPAAFFSNGTFVKNNPNESVIFTGTFMKGLLQKIRTIQHVWLPDVFWGAAVPPGTFNTAFVNSLSNTLASSRAKTFTVNATGGKKIYAVDPVVYGTPTFQIPPGGLAGGFILAATIPYLNAAGLTISMNVWESVQVNLGSNVTVQES